MKNTYFENLETLADGTRLDLTSVQNHLAFNSDGLVPVITQCADTGQVLMMAWMNQESISKTLSTGKMTYWSRSRNQFWIKGETSGHTQQLVEMRFDCDGDALLCSVKQQGPACHTGRPHCFYLRVDSEQQEIQIEGTGK